jgi:hypothetical protein
VDKYAETRGGDWVKASRLVLLFILLGALMVTPFASAGLFVPSRLYTADKGTNNGTIPLTITLSHTPVNGHTLIAVIGTVTGGGSTVTIPSVTQTGVTWSMIKSSVSTGTGKPGTEIWRGVVGAGASTSVVIANPASCLGITADICEYDATLSLDKTAKSDSQSSDTLVTGTTATTSYSIEVLVGGIVSWQYNTTTPTNSFTLQDGASNANNCIVSYLDRIVSSSSTYSSGVTAYVSTSASGCIATLYVSSPPTAYYYTLSSKWENGTATNVTITETYSGGTDNLNVTGTPTVFYFMEKPTAFYWSMSGNYRYMYVTANTGTYVFYQPTSTTYNYEFSIRDYSRRLTGTNYLEAYVGGVLNQRMIVIPGNPTPLNLQLGSTYNIQVLFGDGTRYNWANMVADSDLTKTINIMDLTFDSSAHVVSEFITVEATRSSGDIYALYQDTRSGTIWANVTMRIRNGAIVYTNYTNANSELWVYHGLANTSYVVSLVGVNTRLSTWGYTKILDTSFTFPAPPSLTSIGWTLGGLDLNNAIATVISIVVGCIFSYRWMKLSVLSMTATATLFNWMGFASWGLGILTLCWVISIGVLVAGPSGGISG